MRTSLAKSTSETLEPTYDDSLTPHDRGDGRVVLKDHQGNPVLQISKDDLDALQDRRPDDEVVD